jgi:hypothetical protein
MKEISKDELLYLLYAFSQTREEETVTKSAVKEALSRDKKDLAKQKFPKYVDSIYESLVKQELIKSPKKGRLSLTDAGISIIASNLAVAESSFFDSPKGPKILNSLLYFIKTSYSGSENLTREMSFDTFVEKFKDLYFEEKKHQENRGVVVIRAKEICSKFQSREQISQDSISNYFNRLKSDGRIFSTVEKGDEIIEWVE